MKKYLQAVLLFSLTVLMVVTVPIQKVQAQYIGSGRPLSSAQMMDSLAAAEARAASGERDARAQAAARRLESEGADEQLRRLDDFQQQQTAAARATATAVAQARNADDAEIPLESRRADRLRAHDRELCGLATDLDGCAGAAQPAGGGEAAVRPGGFAG